MIRQHPTLYRMKNRFLRLFHFSTFWTQANLLSRSNTLNWWLFLIDLVSSLCRLFLSSLKVNTHHNINKTKIERPYLLIKNTLIKNEKKNNEASNQFIPLTMSITFYQRCVNIMQWKLHVNQFLINFIQ